MIQVVLVLVLLVIASIEDIRKREISGTVLLGLAGVSLVCSVLSVYRGQSTFSDVAMSLLPGAVVILLAWITREGIGYGDGLLLIAMGPVIGLRGIVMGLVIAFFAGGVLSIILMIFKKVGKRYSFPFVPFMTIGMVVSCFAKI
ncbi:leader peptidase (prepilin peptidase) / N-methyltransferase [Butyrivibrio hungatei DSM 14810]|uniref:Leader peptidase (Prepilin peptidase) / N-methyltransferase n=1 Tax=Butyrivibrio hungatei DSM 14810 TaxID=1121132 RepID=A0A1M7SRX4_9FIRM|nr:A24 family peptidase [Butyrivibrio hungatei]SHN61229.1 leader peptidase (prepilin peptidase) / N-methyltransferase [Butyrivibrio hungatei DSM 14810]